MLQNEASAIMWVFLEVILKRSQWTFSFLLLLPSLFTSYWNPKEVSLWSSLLGITCLIFSVLPSAVYVEFLMKEIQDHSASMTFELDVALKAFNLSFPSLRKPR